MSTILYNFYPILTLILIFVVIWSGWDIGDMKKAEVRAAETGKILRDGAVPMMDDSVSMLTAKDGIPLKSRNMIIPVAAMVLLMPTFLIYTGWNSVDPELGATGMGYAWEALKEGSGSSAVLYSVSGRNFNCHGDV